MLREIIGIGDNARGRGGRARRGAVGEGEGKVEGQQSCGCWAQAEGIVEAVARAGEGVKKLEREGMTGFTYLREKRQASDGRPQRSDIRASRVTADNPQVYRLYRGGLSVFLGERNYETEGE